MKTNKTNILLVAPEFPITYWGFQHSLKFVNKKANFPPLGLLTVAAMLPADFNVRLVDMNVSPLTDADIEWAQLIFISAMIVQKESMQTVVARGRSLGKTIVAGGPFPTGSYQTISDVDHFVLGEAEITLPLFLTDLEAGHPQKIYKSDEKPNLNLTPPPRFDLIKKDSYFSMSLQYSRGCPFQCEFCDIIKLFGRIPRVKTPDRFLIELEALKKTGYRGPVFIVDDNFIGNKAELKKLLPRIIEWQKVHGHPFTFFTEASVDLANEEWLMDRMVASGFNMAFLGIETPVTESLLQAGKSQNTRTSLLDSVHAIQAKGIEVSAGFILGFDKDPDDIFDRQIDFIRRSAIPTAMVGLLTALPGTKLHERLKKEGRILGDSTGNNTHDHSLNFAPVMNEEKLLDGYQKVLSSIYQPREFFNRCSDLIQRLPGSYIKPEPNPDLAKTFLYLGAFIRSLFTQTFSSYGLDYISFLGKVLLTRPSFIVKAVQLAINGHHYFMLTNGRTARVYAESRSFYQYLKHGLAHIKERAEQLGTYAKHVNISELFKLRSDVVSEFRKRTRILRKEQDPRPYILSLFLEFNDSVNTLGEKIVESLHNQLEKFDWDNDTCLKQQFMSHISKLRRVRHKKPLTNQMELPIASLITKLESNIDDIIRRVKILLGRVDMRLKST